jgi:hypothetical protein
MVLLCGYALKHILTMMIALTRQSRSTNANGYSIVPQFQGDIKGYLENGTNFYAQMDFVKPTQLFHSKTTDYQSTLDYQSVARLAGVLVVHHNLNTLQ